MESLCVVTGAAGFIGSHLTQALMASGCRVIGVDNLDPFYDAAVKRSNLGLLTSSRFRFIEADVRDRDRMHAVFADERPDMVFHLAALAGVRPSVENPARFVEVNVDGLVSVLDAARSAECRNVIFASSSSVYGNNIKVPFAETDPVDHPISPYAATKKAGELLCHTYAHLFGLSIAVLRFFTVYGPRQRPDLAIHLFMQKISRGEPITMFGDGSSSRDFTFIDDIVTGVTAAASHVRAQAPGFCRTYNLGGSHPIELRAMIDDIAQVVGCEPKIDRRPMQPGDVERTFADLTRSKAELGYEPRTTFREGLEKQWAWMQAASVIPAQAGTQRFGS